MIIALARHITLNKTILSSSFERNIEEMLTLHTIQIVIVGTAIPGDGDSRRDR